VTKPFSSRELALRVQAVLYQAWSAGPAATPRAVRSGRLEVDVAARRDRSGGRELALTVREFDLLAFLVCHPGRAFTRAELLRDKVGQVPAAPSQLQAVWGVGYRREANPS
jgi:two-component system response regulator ResD